MRLSSDLRLQPRHLPLPSLPAWDTHMHTHPTRPYTATAVPLGQNPSRPHPGLGASTSTSYEPNSCQLHLAKIGRAIEKSHPLTLPQQPCQPLQLALSETLESSSHVVAARLPLPLPLSLLLGRGVGPGHAPLRPCRATAYCPRAAPHGRLGVGASLALHQALVGSVLLLLLLVLHPLVSPVACLWAHGHKQVHQPVQTGRASALAGCGGKVVVAWAAVVRCGQRVGVDMRVTIL